MSETNDIYKRLDELTDRIATIEDLHAIRKLHYAYGYYIDFCQYDEVIQLFSKDAEVIFLSGIYKGHEGIARLYKTWFHEFFMKGERGPVDGFLLDHFQMQDIITVAPDRKTAKGRFRALLMGGCHESREFKPEGLPDQFYEAGIYENDYIMEDGVWKISRLDYIVQWQADYKEGWANTVAHLQPAVETYPKNPLGPDELLPEAQRRGTWPIRQDVEMHYAHPVMGQKFKPYKIKN